MGSPSTDVVRLAGDRLSLPGDVEKVVQALSDDGCVLLKRATSLEPVELALSREELSGSINEDIALNKVGDQSAVRRSRLTITFSL